MKIRFQKYKRMEGRQYSGIRNATKRKKNEWNQGFKLKIPNKEDLSKCENWRAITLLRSISKIVGNNSKQT